MQSTEKMETVSRNVATKTMMNGMRYWLPVVSYAGLIFYLSSQSHPEEQLPLFIFREVSDKFLHAIEYGMLAGLSYRAFRWGAGSTLASYAVLLSILAASLYGATDEVHQSFVPLREASGWDWLADTVGAAIAAVSAGRFFGRERTSLS